MATVIESLRKRIAEANEAYWKKSAPIISDVEYDKLVRSLEKLAPDDPLLKEIGSERISSKDKIRHKRHMYSLNKAYSFDEVIKWAEKCARSEDELFYAGPKYDGLSLEVQGDTLVTRGDGEYGNDISHLARNIIQITQFEYNKKLKNYSSNAFPLGPILDHSEPGERTVGELLIPIERFYELKRTVPEFADYKTPRNMASGFANTKQFDSRMHVADFVSHEAMKLPLTLKQLRTINPKELEARLRDFNGYPTDGIVFFVDDVKYRESLGYTQHHPIGGIALKFVDEQKDTILRKVEWQVGQDHVTPVAVFDPVIIDGVCVNKATFHNAAFLSDSKASIGCKITIERRGGVIPKVVNVETTGDPPVPIIETCPDCGKKLYWNGRYLDCKNYACESKIAVKLVKGLAYLGIKGVGPALARKLISDYFLRDIIDFVDEFGLRDHTAFETKREELKGKGYTASQIAAIFRIRDVMQNGAKASDLLRSMCITNCQDQFVNALVEMNGGVMGVINICPVDYIHTVLVDRPGVAIDALTSFMVWVELNKERFLTYADMFKLIPEEPKKVSDKGVVCFTGAGPKPRKELQTLAEENGYQFTENVNACTVLVCEDPNGSSSKLKRAKAKNIQLMGYDEFLSLMNQA